MVGVVIALFDEAYEFIKHAEFQKTKDIPVYILQSLQNEIVIFLCGPGFRKKKELSTLISLYEIKTILHAGFAGSLAEDIQCGEILTIVSCVDTVNKKLYKLNVWPVDGARQIHLVTVHKPVFDAIEKNELHAAFKADAVDMETARLAGFLQNEFPQVALYALKLAGENDTDERYLKNEIHFRSFFSTRSLWKKTRIILKTGVLNACFIYKRKRFLQKKIYKVVLQALDDKT